MNPKYEVDPTTPGLANPAMLKLLPIRVSILCMRSAILQRGNALSALGRHDEARETYETAFPMLEDEPRCARVDWERNSVFVNIGNTYSRQGDFDKADEHYKFGERLGQDHLDEPGGSERDGLGMVLVAKRSKSFALKKAGKEQEAKDLMKEVLIQQIRKNQLDEEKKKHDAEAALKKHGEQEANAAEEAAKAAENPAK